MTRAKPREHCRAIFKKLCILPLPCQYILNILVFVKKHLEVTLNSVGDQHSYSTRNKYNFSLVEHRTVLYKKGCKYTGIVLYNKLPSYIKARNPLNQFRKELQSFLLHHCFYSIKEYMEY